MSKTRIILGAAVAILSSSWSGSALAQAADPAATPVPVAAQEPHRAWLQAGVFGGLLFVSHDHSLYSGKHEAFKSPVGELGARLALLPAPFLGLEVEGVAGPTRTADSDKAAGLWAARGHLLLQLPGKTFTPFVLGGAGALGAGSNPTGSDTDPAVHFGIGAKLAFDDFVGARLDLRDVISAKHSADDSDNVHNPEVLLGLSFNLDFDKDEPPPAPPADRDGDGFIDDKDACPDAAGIVPNGCPAPKDSDADGFIDDKDACPTEKGIAPVGCPDLDPDRDPDRDGVLAPNDKCPDQQETKNGFEDLDGCPDTLPEKIKKFSGVIPGIEFDLGKATIRPASNAILSEAAGVLEQYPDLRVSVSGHTDDVGDRKHNLELSEQRAAAVKAYLVGRGIKAERIDTRGAGSEEPIADNKQADGRQKNRRIEFKLLSP